MISLSLLPVALLVLVGFCALLLNRSVHLSHALGAAGAVGSSLVGLGITIVSLLTAQSETLALPWNTSIGASFSVGFDPLSGFFLLPIYGLTAVCAIFGFGYLGHSSRNRGLGPSWFFFCILAASMALVVIARNAVLFLVAWEIMSFSSWALVTHEHEREEARQAGITYLIATQIGTAFLLVMFLTLGAAASAGAPAASPSAANQGAVLDFSRFALGSSATMPAVAGVVFLLSVIGFGTKAGIVPLHVWLPEAHPAAPSHVSALMSGVMIKTGIYGILRVLTFLGEPPAWWGWTLVIVGAASGIIGVLFALAQHDIKKLLAYHSVENIGIICLGIGVGLLGVSDHVPAVAVLGFAGGMLHILNHAIFKGLLFLGAGAAAHAAGTREMDRLGGLLHRMPLTGVGFLVGAAAISGLPPLNGFVSELLIFLGSFAGFSANAIPLAVASAVSVAGLALISGLAAACFTKAFGISFLGEPRTPEAADAKEPAIALVAPVLLLAAACAAIGALGSYALSAVAPLAGLMTGILPSTVTDLTAPAQAGLQNAAFVAFGVVGLTAALALVRTLAQRARSVRQAGTWDCGYVRPDARMQYTSSSFAQPLTGMFNWLLHPARHMTPLRELFPARAEFATETPDVFRKRLFGPIFQGAATAFSRLAWLQHGRLQLYVLYLAAALLVLLVWRLG
ncbi:MAG TPA: proton-conducting transporter membrane subunit [Spirochaetia bacterium]|nr:proton-conducting transporter membrane subunit [Spirochaetia bacterium]